MRAHKGFKPNQDGALQCRDKIWLVVTVAAVLLIARGARHLYRASGALIDHMTGPDMVRAARRWEQR